MPVKRVLGLAAVWRSGVCAGTIESSNGSARVTPIPRRRVRREMCFLVISMDGPCDGRQDRDRQAGRGLPQQRFVMRNLKLQACLESAYSRARLRSAGFKFI